MEKVKITTEYIKLDQFIKLVGAADTGADAKNDIISGMVKVNGEKETRRGKKLRPGDRVEAGGKLFQVE